MPSLSYRDLIVWQKSMELVVEIYSLTKQFPPSELFGLVSQMRRCAVSIPSNIAEGRMRSSRKDYRNFLIIARSSGAELETQLEIVKRIAFEKKIDLKRAGELLSEVMKMLSAMIQTLEQKVLTPDT